MKSIFNTDLLRNQVAIVVSDSMDMAKSIVMELARVGADVVLACKDTKEVPAEISNVADQFGMRFMVVQTNIRDPQSCDDMARKVADVWGKIDILVIQTGGEFPIPSEQLSVGIWNSAVDANLNGAYYCVHACGGYMRESRYGRIIFVGLVWAANPIPGLLHSFSARAGIVGLSKTLAAEWGKYNVTSNVLAHGIFPGAPYFAHDSYEHRYRDYETAIPLRRQGDLHDVGWNVVYLCSPAASYLTGEVITIDGGRRIGSGLSFAGY